MNNPLSIIISRLFAELDADVIDGHTTELFDINLTDAEITERGALDSMCNENRRKKPRGYQPKNPRLRTY